MYLKIEFTSSEPKRPMLNGGLCTEKAVRYVKCSNRTKKGGWNCCTNPNWVIQKELFAVLETLLYVIEWGSCNQSVFLFVLFISKGSFISNCKSLCTLLTNVGLMDGFDYGQESWRLFTFEHLCSAKKHSLQVQLQQNGPFVARKLDSKHSA